MNAKEKIINRIKRMLIAMSISLVTFLVIQQSSIYQSAVDVVEVVLTPSYDWPPTLTKYNISTNSMGIQPLWEIENIALTQLVASNSTLFYLGARETTEPSSLHAIGLSTRGLAWQTDPILSGSTTLAQNSTTIFVGSGVPGKITAYNSETGAILWLYDLPHKSKFIEYLYASETQLFVKSSSGRFDILDTNSGDVIDFTLRPFEYRPFTINNGIVYQQSSYTKFQAADMQNGTILWETNLDEEFFHSPVFTEGLVLIKTSKFASGKIVALELTTGTIRWETQDNIISNITVDNNRAYFLTENAELIVVDIYTGTEIGWVNFTPTILELDPMDFINRKFFVASSDNIVVVYFGSSWQMFAFRVGA